MKSLYSRVFIITISAVLISSLLGFLASNIYYHMKLKPFNDEKLIDIANHMRLFTEQHPELMESYLNSVAQTGYEIYVTDKQGNEQYYGHGFRQLDLMAAARKLVLEGGVYHGVAQFPNKPFISGFFNNSLSNTVGIPLQLIDKRYALFLRPDVELQFGELRSFFAMIGLLTVLFSVLIFLISTRYLVKPIAHLTDATKRIALGQYELTLPEKRRDEIGQLAAHFRSMSRELERAEQARKQFVSNVSHEIQSPLTSIKGFAQSLINPELEAEERVRYATIIAEESGHLSRLSKQLLTLSSLEESTNALIKKPFQLRTQIRQIAQVLEWQLTDKMLALSIAVPDEVILKGDELLLSQVWTNLLVNAVKHTPVGGEIAFRAASVHDGYEIKISDTGSGIAEENLPFLFDRFYRVDPSRGRESGGTGLGLSIVKKIVQLHDGSIEVTSQLGHGTVFVVKLPQL
ncbi:cell wall metabolism sensor histidine kinase WalK [Paenibacillus sp. OV219]|uniref:sensor histidine kinase n=1 Tax=Paenibacillus sp. OV219 TaxID=1884377 RepID=UPI0008BD56DC|nr:HAMP domain-containing sensor histidine kinase [Paenibacillus sp. OV219]SEN49143.1 Signal transduction histidine kinase [Paenibacillus sp. OV219]